MKYFSIGKYGKADDPASLLLFLEECQLLSKKKGKPQLVNISMDVFHIDPLAILEAVYEENNKHCFLENPRLEQSLAGIESLLSYETSGVERFRAVKDWAKTVLNNAVYTGNTEAPYCGVHFFCAFNFFDEGQELVGFPPAQVFVPLWQVSKKEEHSLAIANCIIDSNTPIEKVAQRILGAYQRFSSFPYQASEDLEGITSSEKEYVISESGEAGGFEKSVSQVLENIEAGDFNKIVLARAKDYKSETPLKPLAIIDRLRNRFPNCFTFSYSAGAEGVFLGSSPELLIRVKENILSTDALAGSRPRGGSAGEDAALGNELLNSDKEGREHRSVIDSIVKHLKAIGLEPQVASRPRLLKLPNIQHLYSPIEAELPDNTHILDIVEKLHPTPAVGGSPRELACPKIPEMESFTRGPYGGPVGWFDARGDGEFVVGIRSGILKGNEIRLFSGAGIVEGSEPEKELLETEIKFKAVSDVLK